jgi:hypothetical protein
MVKLLVVAFLLAMIQARDIVSNILDVKDLGVKFFNDHGGKFSGGLKVMGAMGSVGGAYFAMK